MSARHAPLMLFALVAPARADTHQCVAVHVDLTPADSLQIVAWIEDAAGHYVDTIMVTNKIGHYGIGNRPGRFDLNSGPPPNAAMHVDDLAPYGRRTTTFPVWAHRHGMTFPEVVFQNGDESDVSHPISDSSAESSPPFCRPLLPGTDPSSDPATCGCLDRMMWDTGTCASQANTDKGVFSMTATSLYPPRADLTRVPAEDSPSVALYAATNPFDAVSRATPVGGAATAITWVVPPTLPAGDYVLWVELAKEFDFNATYNPTSYPSPTGIPYGGYGAPYRGQPSVVYSAAFTIGATESIATTMSYAGYGAPDGQDGNLRPPDATITTDTPGSGASRLQLVSDNGTLYRLRVDSQPVLDSLPPDVPGGLAVTSTTGTHAALTFVAPGDDGQIGRASGYDIRIRANDPLTADNFDGSMRVTATVVPVDAGGLQHLDIDGLLPSTDYWIGVRAYDKCHNTSGLAIVKLTTGDRQSGVVDACFVATAAYGSMMANDVELLREFRDAKLRRVVLGELAVETYYTFGPALAGVVGESDLLRATARAALAPLVARVRRMSL